VAAPDKLAAERWLQGLVGGEGVGENAPGCGGVLLAREKEVAAMVLWPPCGVGGATCGSPGADKMVL
jgi:hypothetical protein